MFSVESSLVSGPPVPGQNGHWWSETKKTVSSRRDALEQLALARR